MQSSSEGGALSVADPQTPWRGQERAEPWPNCPPSWTPPPILCVRLGSLKQLLQKESAGPSSQTPTYPYSYYYRNIIYKFIYYLYWILCLFLYHLKFLLKLSGSYYNILLHFPTVGSIKIFSSMTSRLTKGGFGDTKENLL